MVGTHKADYIDLNNSNNNLADSGAAYVFTKPETDANGDLSTDWKDWDSLNDEGKAALTAKAHRR